MLSCPILPLECISVFLLHQGWRKTLFGKNHQDCLENGFTISLAISIFMTQKTREISHNSRQNCTLLNEAEWNIIIFIIWKWASITVGKWCKSPWDRAFKKVVFHHLWSFCQEMKRACLSLWKDVYIRQSVFWMFSFNQCCLIEWDATFLLRCSSCLKWGQVCELYLRFCLCLIALFCSSGISWRYYCGSAHP